MRRGVVLADLMMQTLLNFMEPGDPELRIDLENVTVIVSKQIVEDYNNDTVETKHGTLDVANVTSLIDVDPLDCIEQALFFASFDPRLYVDTAFNVNSHTLRFLLDLCSVVNGTEVITADNNDTEDRSVRSDRNATCKISVHKLYTHLDLYQCPFGSYFRDVVRL